jgi:hypothetical protein
MFLALPFPLLSKGQLMTKLSGGADVWLRTVLSALATEKGKKLFAPSDCTE